MAQIITADLLNQLGMSEEQIAQHFNNNALICTLIPLAVDEIREQGRAYNPSEWDRIIDRYSALRGCAFYKRDRATSPFEYDEYFAVYYTSDGLRLFKSVGYGSSLTNAPFVEVAFDGLNLHYVRRNKRYEKTNDNRAFLAKSSEVFGNIYTTEF